jgi:hypothetical protein
MSPCLLSAKEPFNPFSDTAIGLLPADDARIVGQQPSLGAVVELRPRSGSQATMSWYFAARLNIKKLS